MRSHRIWHLPLALTCFIAAAGAARAGGVKIGERALLYKRSPAGAAVGLAKDRSLRQTLHQLAVRDAGGYRAKAEEAARRGEWIEVPSGTTVVVLAYAEEQLPLRGRCAKVHTIAGAQIGVAGWCDEADLLPLGGKSESAKQVGQRDPKAWRTTSLKQLTTFEDRLKYKVNEIDADNRVVIDWRGHPFRFALLGVDAPRIEARRFLQKVLAGRRVFLQYDSDGTRDTRGNPAAYIYRDDGMFINLELVSHGLAGASDEGGLSKLLTQAESEARDAERGLWADGRSPMDRSHNSKEYQASLRTTREKSNTRWQREQAARAKNRDAESMFRAGVNAGLSAASGSGMGGMVGPSGGLSNFGIGRSGVGHYCGAPTQAGHPCRNWVVNSNYCHLHGY